MAWMDWSTARHGSGPFTFDSLQATACPLRFINGKHLISHIYLIKSQFDSTRLLACLAAATRRNSMSTVTRLQSSQHALHNLYAQHAWECTDLQRVLLSSHPLDATYLADQPNIFRCLKSSHYNPEQAAQRLTHTLTWRAAQDFTLESLPEELFSIISVHLDVRDVCARPACVFRLKNLPTKGKHDGLPRYLVAMLEVMRRALANERRGAAQMALVVDLQGAGYSNLVCIHSEFNWTLNGLLD